MFKVDGRDAEDRRAQDAHIQVSPESCERHLPHPWGVLGHYSLPHKAPEYNLSRHVIATKAGTERKKASKVFNAGEVAVLWPLLYSSKTETVLISKGLKKDTC